MRTYIAGPIANKPNGNREGFHRAVFALRRAGMDPVNPHDIEPVQHDGPCPDGPTGGQEGDGVVRHNAPCYMRTDLTAMLECDAIYMLTGWEQSSGARTEFEAARAAGLTIFYERPAIDPLHLIRQRDWSYETFGPDARTKGVIDHIRKELVEIEAAPEDLEEWIDVVILALDGAWRAGHSPRAISEALSAKQARNELRSWPDWRTASPDHAIEHVEELA